MSVRKAWGFNLDLTTNHAPYGLWTARKTFILFHDTFCKIRMKISRFFTFVNLDSLSFGLFFFVFLSWWFQSGSIKFSIYRKGSWYVRSDQSWQRISSVNDTTGDREYLKFLNFLEIKFPFRILANPQRTDPWGNGFQICLWKSYCK